MKKILIIHHGRGVGGGLIALIGLIDELKTNNKLEVLSIFDGIAVQYIRKTGVNVVIPKSKFYLKYYEIFVSSAARYFSVIDSIKKAKALILYLLSKYYFAQKELETITFDYDVVYLNSTFISDWSRGAKCLKKKVVIHVREPLSNGFLDIGRQIIRKTVTEYCDSIVAISHDNANRLGIPNKTTVVYDPVVNKSRNHVENVAMDSSCRYFLYLGGMMRIKGFEQMVESLDYLEGSVRVFFLGSEAHYSGNGMKYKLRQLLDPYFWRHEFLVKKLMASPNVIYVGQTDDVFSYFNKSVALISPFSKPHASLPILEAFSLGVPVIASNVEGMEELVDGKNGLLFENNKPRSLANRVNEIALLSKEEYEQMKKASLDSYVQIRNSNCTVSEVLRKL